LLCLQVLSHIIETSGASGFEKNLLYGHLTEFEDILGDCERLLITPIPVAYGRHATRFQMIWFSMFPVLMQPTLGDSVIPVTFFLGIAIFGALSAAAAVIESWLNL
jgi:predicted membrane chloride channel (bestrophin family)